MNGLNYLEGGIYNISGKFDNIELFLNYLSRYFKDMPFDKKLVLNKIEEIINTYDLANAEVIDQKKALQLLVSDELKKIIKVINTIEMENPYNNLEIYHDRYCEFFSKRLGENIEFPRLFLVDRFPGPYKKLKTEALAPDMADEDMYGIPSGIYFLKDFLSPYYSAYLLPHEIVHTIVGKPNPYLLGRGLEEGIADLFGSIYGGIFILGETVTQNLTIYNRLSQLSNPIWSIYRDYLRQATFIYRKFGFMGIKELIRGGRDKIKKTEKQLINGNFDLSLPVGDWDQKLNKNLDYLLSIFIKNLTASPLAKYLSLCISAGDNIKMVIKDLNIDPRQGKKALYELQNHLYVLLINEKGTIDYFDDWLSKDIRYKILKQYV